MGHCCYFAQVEFRLLSPRHIIANVKIKKNKSCRLFLLGCSPFGARTSAGKMRARDHGSQGAKWCPLTSSVFLAGAYFMPHALVVGALLKPYHFSVYLSSSFRLPTSLLCVWTCVELVLTIMCVWICVDLCLCVFGLVWTSRLTCLWTCGLIFALCY
jgi:hypothetical protein